MVLTLSAVTGGTIGLLFENVLMVLLEARSACCTTASQPLAVAVGAWHHDGHLAAGGATTIPLVAGTSSLYAYYVMMRAANVWPLKFYLPIVSVVVVLLLAGLMGGSMLLWAVLAGAGTGFAVRCAGLDAAECTSPHDAEIATSAPGG